MLVVGGPGARGRKDAAASLLGSKDDGKGATTVVGAVGSARRYTVRPGQKRNNCDLIRLGGASGRTSLLPVAAPVDGLFRSSRRGAY